MLIVLLFFKETSSFALACCKLQEGSFFCACDETHKEFWYQ
jgi:hypothetical protein